MAANGAPKGCRPLVPVADHKSSGAIADEELDEAAVEELERLDPHLAQKVNPSICASLPLALYLGAKPRPPRETPRGLYIFFWGGRALYSGTKPRGPRGLYIWGFYRPLVVNDPHPCC
jgi:hypothetical protein